jgi:hypothetical protein
MDEYSAIVYINERYPSVRFINQGDIRQGERFPFTYVAVHTKGAYKVHQTVRDGLLGGVVETVRFQETRHVRA